MNYFHFKILTISNEMRFPMHVWPFFQTRNEILLICPFSFILVSLAVSNVQLRFMTEPNTVRISLILHIFGVNVLEQKFLAYFHVNFKSQSSQSARNHPLSEEAVKYPVDKRPMISVSFLINEPLLKLISLEVIHLFCHLSFVHFLCCWFFIA